MHADALERLRGLLHGFGSCVVAYSGGVDSTLLAYVARGVLGVRSLAVLADTPSLPRRELADAIAMAKRLNFELRIIATNELASRKYTVNPPDRCYHCKRVLFAAMASVAKEGNYAVILHGENASDTGDSRPGARAAIELGVRAPLKETGLTKADVRALAARLGLPVADKPPMACLSSRVPYGQRITLTKLETIEQAEYVLRDLGFRQVRVRHHELPRPSGSSESHLARIELGVNELPRLFADNLWRRVSNALGRIGYEYVTVDLEGYRSGSIDEARRAPVADGVHPRPLQRPPLKRGHRRVPRL